MAALTRHVHVHDPEHGSVVFGPGDKVPAWARKRITRDDVWSDASDTEDPADGADEGTPEPPPRTGQGSGVQAWRDFATHPDIALDVDEDASKDDIVAAWDATQDDVDEDADGDEPDEGDDT